MKVQTFVPTPFCMYLYIYTYLHNIFALTVQSTDVDDEVERHGRKEPFIVVAETDDSLEYIFSIHQILGGCSS